MFQNIFGNMINSADDLEWYMINFIRHYKELEEKFERYDGVSIEDIEKDKRDNEEFYERYLREYEGKVKELIEEKRELIVKFMELYDMMLKYRNDDGDSVTVKQKREMSKFRKLLKAELHEMDLEDEIPF